jgi:hypothetical protein
MAKLEAVVATRDVACWRDTEDGLQELSIVPKGAALPYVGLREVRRVDEFGKKTMATAIYYRTIFNGEEVLVWPPHFKEMR